MVVNTSDHLAGYNRIGGEVKIKMGREATMCEVFSGHINGNT